MSAVSALPVLPVLLIEPVASNCSLLTHWLNAAAEDLGIACEICRCSEPVVASRHPSLVFLSPMMAEALAGQSGFAACLLWVHGGSGVLPQGAQAVPWPVKKERARMILAEAAVRIGVVGRNDEAGCPFGNQVPEPLLSLIPRLVETVHELLGQCEMHIRNGDNENAARAAHSLKGAALSFGQQILAECAEVLKDAVQAGNAEETARMAAVLRLLVYGA
ncbi:Hpt domain-containing protein [Desulfovibrio mangrovi]|uniref:Hpt domain-containing protein n=1 Tax=Desulfovibrio mangrovi TaxID=2976983 RepID=UPI0022456092|nr:Hpt domain-containing protein [Desulfovibrio mangrovi]UZP69021.1 Hpt domain-containing protein [Desulfovibrio mangrovi]